MEGSTSNSFGSTSQIESANAVVPPLKALATPARKAWLRRALFLFGATALSLEPSPAFCAAPVAFRSLRIVEAVNSVEVTEGFSKKKHPAKANEAFGVGSVLGTGAKSRAELNSPDGTVTRVGAHTLFSINEEKREVSLQKGTLLFHSPTGKGGGVIKAPGATAGVIGTSIIVSATSDGGFKLLVLEGTAKATLPGGKNISLGAGQLTFIQRGSMAFGPVVNFRLRDQVAGAKLVGGFKAPLASLQKIKEAVEAQEKKIAEGNLEKTLFQVAGSTLVDSSLVQLRAGANGSLQKALASDVIVRGGVLEKERLFEYANGEVPAELLALFGPGAGTVSSESPEGRATYFAGRNIALLGQQGDILSDYTLPLFVFSARDTLTIDEGRGPTDPALLNPKSEIYRAFGSSSEPNSGPSIWLVAGQKINVVNSKINFRGDTLVVGSPFLKGGGEVRSSGGAFIPPPQAVEIRNSALLNGGGEIVVTGAKVNVSESSIISAKSVGVIAGAIDINSVAARDILAGYGNWQVGEGTAMSASGSSLMLYANDTLSVKNARLGGERVSLDARTVALEGVDFKDGSTVVLSSGLGLLAGNPNTGRPVEPRKVNFIRNVTYGGLPAESVISRSLSPITLRANGR